MADEITNDAFFAGALRLAQPRRGHRIGTDAVLLAASCPPDAQRVVDLGSGVGAVGLRVAQTLPAAHVRLIDLDDTVLELARQNILHNGLSGRCAAVRADIFDRQPIALDFPAGAKADVVLTNPPFDAAGTVRASPVAGRASAHVMAGDLERWIVAGLKLLRPAGHMIVIHRADALDRLLSAMAGRFGGLALRPVHPRAGEPATRILLTGVVGSRAPLKILPPLTLHAAGGGFTQEADALHTGSAVLGWDT